MQAGAPYTGSNSVSGIVSRISIVYADGVNIPILPVEVLFGEWDSGILLYEIKNCPTSKQEECKNKYSAVPLFSINIFLTTG